MVKTITLMFNKITIVNPFECQFAARLIEVNEWLTQLLEKGTIMAAAQLLLPFPLITSLTISYQ